jgi:hypothetical protein
MQLAGLQTELSEINAEYEHAMGEAARYSTERQRLPHLVASGEIPLIYSTTARDGAGKTVTALNGLFDQILQRRAELAAALPRYRAELVQAQAAAAGMASQESLSAAARLATEVLQQRVEVAQSLSDSLEQMLSGIVDATQEAAQFAVDLGDAIRVGEPRRIGTRSARALNRETPSDIASDAGALAGWWQNLAWDASAAIGERIGAAPIVLTLGTVLGVVVLWLAIGRAVPRWFERRLGEEPLQLDRATRVGGLVVACGRGLVLVACWAAMCLTWGVPDAWLHTGESFLGAWATFIAMRLVLRWALSPDNPELRVIDIRQEAAQNLYATLIGLGFYTTVLVPFMALVGQAATPLAELSRSLQLAYGAGMVLIGTAMVRRAGGLSGVLPAPRTAAKSLVHHGACPVHS